MCSTPRFSRERIERPVLSDKCNLRARPLHKNHVYKASKGNYVCGRAVCLRIDMSQISGGIFQPISARPATTTLSRHVGPWRGVISVVRSVVPLRQPPFPRGVGRTNDSHLLVGPESSHIRKDVPGAASVLRSNPSVSCYYVCTGTVWGI